MPWEGCHPGQLGSLPEGQVGVIPLPASEGIALPPPQIGFHTHPELVWHPTARPLHPPGSWAWKDEPTAPLEQSAFSHPPASGLQLPLIWVRCGWVRD